MTSRILSILKMFPRITGSQVQSSQPNSWALMDVWRHLYEPNDESCKEELNETMETVDLRSNTVNNKPTEPILSDTAVAERRLFLRGNFKDARSPWFTIYHPLESASVPMSNRDPSPSRLSSMDRENQILYQPNLDIPIGNSYMTLAQ